MLSALNWSLKMDLCAYQHHIQIVALMICNPYLRFLDVCAMNLWWNTGWPNCMLTESNLCVDQIFLPILVHIVSLNMYIWSFEY